VSNCGLLASVDCITPLEQPTMQSAVLQYGRGETRTHDLTDVNRAL